MKLSKTAIFNIVKSAAGVLALFGIVVDVELIANHIEVIAGSSMALWFIADGIIGVLLRKKTSKPLVPGSLLNKES